MGGRRAKRGGEEMERAYQEREEMARRKRRATGKLDPEKTDVAAAALADVMAAAQEAGEGVGLEEVVREVMGRVVTKLLEAEMAEHLGYEERAVPPAYQANRRNGRTSKTVRTSLGPVEIEVPRDREGTFEPKVLPKYKRELGEMEEKILALYGRGMSVRDIQEMLRDIYGTEVSGEFISRVTDRILPELEAWRSRPLESEYYIVYVDALMAKTRETGSVGKRAVYTVVGVCEDGHKEVLGLYIWDNETSKFWMAVFEDLRRRGVSTILVVAADGLAGLSEAVEAVFPEAIFQTCIVHMVRASMKFVSYKDRKEVSADLKRVYMASGTSEAQVRLAEFGRKWDKKYPSISAMWRRRWDEWTPFLELPEEARRAIYTTNAIEALHRRMRKVIKTKGAFPSDQALLKTLYLAIKLSTGKWGNPSPYWRQARMQFDIYFGRVEA
jgi:transposase-like protein